MGNKTTKDQITQMRQKLQSEIDWDLLEQLDMEEEGQVLPMQDPPPTTASSSSSPPWASRYASTRGQCRQWTHHQKALPLASKPMDGKVK